jgi:hypothetical protein
MTTPATEKKETVKKVLITVPIILLGSLVRHVMLIPEKQRGHYTAHVREGYEPLIEKMINESLTEDPPSGYEPPTLEMPSPHFVVKYQELAGTKGFGELHSVLAYFPRSANKTLQNEERLRVQQEYISNKAVTSTGESGVQMSNDHLVQLFFERYDEFKKNGDGITDKDFMKRQVMVLYDHDPQFRELIDGVVNNPEKRERFCQITRSCEGGLLLAINDREVDNESAAASTGENTALKWFQDTIDLCFHETLKNRSVVIVSADALRKCGERIMERGAVEDSVNDVVKVIYGKAFRLDEFKKKCRHLVIVFRETGALHIDFTEDGGTVTYGPNFDRHAQTHPSTYGRVPGKFTSMVTSIVRDLCWTSVNGEKLDVPGALRMAVAAYNYHYDTGFAQAAAKGSPFNDYVDILSHSRRAKLIDGFKDGKDEFLLASVPFPLDKAASQTWNRLDLDEITANFEDKLIKIVKYGIQKPFRGDFDAIWEPNFKPGKSITVPYSEYGKLTLVDPEEIRRFSSLAKLIDKYIGTPTWTTPLSIAVFGAPGTGKSFSVKQIIQRVSPDRKTAPLIFNLAQFSSVEHLTEAFHKVQDVALAAQEVPLVVFDEFDSHFSQTPLGWLKYFLAPMQDGVFRGKDADYRVGRAIFLFAGGTSETFAEFKGQLKKSGSSTEGATKPQPDDESKVVVTDFAKEVKLPDFISRLRGHLDVIGINPPKDKTFDQVKNERTFLLRRAILLRSALNEHAGEIFRKIDPKRKFANIHEDLIKAFLYAERYEHGSRSMEAIVQMSRFIDGYFVPTSLPTRELLETHVHFNSYIAQIRGWHPDAAPVAGGANTTGAREAGREPRMGVMHDAPPHPPASNRLKPFDIDDANQLALCVDEAALLEPRQNPAHGFQRDAQVAAHVFARHAQAEFGLRVAALPVARRHVHQEGGHALLGGERAQHHHLRGFLVELVAHEAVQAVLHRAALAAQGLERGIRQRADRAVFERDCAEGVHVVGNAVQAQRVAGQAQPGDLLAPVTVDNERLERAGAHGVQAVEAVARAIERLPAAHLARPADQGLELGQIFGREALRHAQMAHGATRAARARRRHAKRSTTGLTHDGGGSCDR